MFEIIQYLCFLCAFVFNLAKCIIGLLELKDGNNH